MENRNGTPRAIVLAALLHIGIVAFLGLAIIYTDLLRPGGWPAVGAIIVVIGVVDAALAPRMLKKLWAQQDAANK